MIRTKIVAGMTCVLALLWLVGCDYQPQEIPEIAVRTTVESENADDARIRVFVEGPDGNMVTGSVVTVRNSKNAMLKIPFDPESFCYTASFPVPSEDLLYFCVQTLLTDTVTSYSIPHGSIEADPEIKLFRDSLGNSVLSGQALDADSPIQIAWDSLGDGVVYEIAISSASETLYTVSTHEFEIQIPAGSIKAGTGLFAEIIARRIFGDPFFRFESYYSVSTRKSAKMGFSVVTEEDVK